MPESPELATSRDFLKKRIEGKALTDLSVGLTGRYVKSPPAGLAQFLEAKSRAGSPRVVEVRTHGKFMWWRFNFPNEHEDFYLHCTFGMSGGWFASPSKHTAFIVEYNGSGVPITRDTQKLFFNDPRHFGTLKFVRGNKEHEKKLKTLGPCILTSHVTPEIFAERALRKPHLTLAEILMDQSCVAGIGNYMKSETAFRSGLSPWRRVDSLTPQNFIDLLQEAKSVAQESYQSQGASLLTYKTPDGSRGEGQFTLRVYGQESCPAGHPIVREETPEGRTSHWCPICQT